MPEVYFFCSVFYSIKQLPEIWQTISVFNPILNIVDTFRYGIIGISDVNLYFGFILICVLFGTLFVWCLYLLKRGTGLRT